MADWTLGVAAWQGMASEARRAFPREACGVVLGSMHTPSSHSFVAFENVQDRLHALDPESYPRDGRTAFAMDGLRLSRVIREAEARGDVLVAVVHSHPQYPAYFSATDRASAMSWGQPTYPDALQLVVSVFDAVVRDVKAFGWSGTSWEEREVRVPESLPGPPAGAKPLEEDEGV